MKWSHDISDENLLDISTMRALRLRVDILGSHCNIILEWIYNRNSSVWYNFHSIVQEQHSVILYRNSFGHSADSSLDFGDQSRRLMSE